MKDFTRLDLSEMASTFQHIERELNSAEMRKAELKRQYLAADEDCYKQTRYKKLAREYISFLTETHTVEQKIKFQIKLREKINQLYPTGTTEPDIIDAKMADLADLFNQIKEVKNVR